MKRILKNKLVMLLIFLTLAAAVLIGIFAALSGREKASTAENIVLATEAPGQSAVHGIGGWISNIFSYFGSVKALKEENEALKLENIELDKQLRDARGLEVENDSLREMLDLVKTENKMELKAAKVVSKEPSDWYGGFTINKGSKDGIKKDMPVITANYALVGKITRVGTDWAEVMTVLDPECGVGGIIERSKVFGIVEGDFSLRYSGMCRFGYLERDADTEKGDYIETSGMGGIYPKGLLIGRITDIKEDNTNMSKYAVIEPLADISGIMQVLVVIGNTEVVKRKTDLGSGLSDDDTEEAVSEESVDAKKSKDTESTDTVTTKNSVKTSSDSESKSAGKNAVNSSDTKSKSEQSKDTQVKSTQQSKSGDEKSSNQRVNTIDGSELKD